MEWNEKNRREGEGVERAGGKDKIDNDETKD